MTEIDRIISDIFETEYNHSIRYNVGKANALYDNGISTDLSLTVAKWKGILNAISNGKSVDFSDDRCGFCFKYYDCKKDDCSKQCPFYSTSDGEGCIDAYALTGNRDEDIRGINKILDKIKEKTGNSGETALDGREYSSPYMLALHYIITSGCLGKDVQCFSCPVRASRECISDRTIDGFSKMLDNFLKDWKGIHRIKKRDIG